MLAAHSLRISSTNANSLLSKMSDIFIEAAEFQPDILTVTETKLHQGIQDAEAYLPLYSLLRQDRPDNQRGGGVVIYTKDHLDI